MNNWSKYKEPLLFMAAALLVCGLCYGLLFRGAPERAGSIDIATTGEPEFNPGTHLTAIKADSFVVLLHQVYATANASKGSGRLKVLLSGQGARASDFYNDNPYLLKVSSKDFSIAHDKSRDEIAATFTLHTEGGSTFIRVPNDILFQLTQKAANAQHG